MAASTLLKTYKAAYQHNTDTKQTTWADVRDIDNKQWAGLLPGTKDASGKTIKSLDTLLRTELIKYGEMAQATYDGFEGDDNSPDYAKQYWTFDKLLDGVTSTSWSKINQRYEIKTKGDYLYASASLYNVCGEKNPNQNTWVGYIAVTKKDQINQELSKGKDIVVAFRGTVRASEWKIDGKILGQDYDTTLRDFEYEPLPDAKEEEKPHRFRMHDGFYEMYDKEATIDGKKISPRETVRQRLLALVAEGNVKSITFVGHSLGGALAALAAADIGVLRKYDRRYSSADWQNISLAAYTFAAPRVADDLFRKMLRNSIKVRLLNVVNYGDVVPCSPSGFKTTTWLIGSAAAYINTGINGVLARFAKYGFWTGVALADRVPSLWKYTDTGTILLINIEKIPQYIRKLKGLSLGEHHALEGYLFVLTKQHTSAAEDDPELFRDVALVNKSYDMLVDELKKEYGIPVGWFKAKALLGPPSQPPLPLCPRKDEDDNTVWRAPNWVPNTATGNHPSKSQ